MGKRVSRDDFPGLLPPMLVKELRQGLRTKVFVNTFVFLQSFMLATLTLEALYPSSKDLMANLVWMAIGFTLVGLAPLRCLAAITSETSQNTLDLLLLTRQRPFGIVMGKWFANMAQIALALVSILPYVVARHFLGAGDVLVQLTSLWHIFLTSCIFCAAAIALSAVPGKILRLLAGLVLLGGAGSVVFLSSAAGMDGGGAYLIDSFATMFVGVGWVAWVSQVVITAIVVWLVLEFGAGRISPPGHSRSGYRRLLFPVGAVICLLFYIERSDIPLPCMAGLGLIALACVDALTEGAPPRRPEKGSFAFTYLFGSGWQTGVLYCVLCSLIGAVVVWILSILYSEDAGVAVLPIVFGAQLVLPAFFLRIFLRDGNPHADSLQAYLITQIVFCMVSGLIMAVADTANSVGLVAVISFIPIVAISFLGMAADLWPYLLLMQGVTLLLTAFGVAFFGREFFPKSSPVVIQPKNESDV